MLRSKTARILSLICLLSALGAVGASASSESGFLPKGKWEDRLLFLSTVFAPELTTYGPITTTAVTSLISQLTEAIENSYYATSVEPYIDPYEIHELRRDAQEFLATDMMRPLFAGFVDMLYEVGVDESITPERVATYLVLVADAL